MRPPGLALSPVEQSLYQMGEPFNLGIEELQEEVLPSARYVAGSVTQGEMRCSQSAVTQSEDTRSF